MHNNDLQENAAELLSSLEKLAGKEHPAMYAARTVGFPVLSGMSSGYNLAMGTPVFEELGSLAAGTPAYLAVSKTIDHYLPKTDPGRFASKAIGIMPKAMKKKFIPLRFRSGPLNFLRFAAVNGPALYAAIKASEFGSNLGKKLPKIQYTGIKDKLRRMRRNKVREQYGNSK